VSIAANWATCAHCHSFQAHVTQLEQELAMARSQVQTVAGTAQRREVCLQSLGPFAVVPIDSASLGFMVFPDPSGGLYQVDMGKERLRVLTSISELVEFGSLSPSARITLSPEDRDLARIPKNAKAFAFAYPLAGAAEAGDMQRLNLSDPHIAFLALGGFVYLDGENLLCGVNALCQGKGLYFCGPQPFRRPGLRDKLFRDGRIQDVTVDSLVKIGIKGFCWLSPAESFTTIDGADGSDWPHGAFLYVYDDRHKDCIFRVGEAPQESKAEDALQTNQVVPFSVACGKGRDELRMRAVAESQAPEAADFTCKVCMEHQIEVVLIPCGHLCLCKGCASSAGMSACPVCRQSVQRRVNVFL